MVIIIGNRVVSQSKSASRNERSDISESAVYFQILYDDNAKQFN